jgi:hypothetical protein
MTVWPKDAPGMNYHAPEVKPKRCGACDHGNPCTLHHSTCCELMKKKFEEAGISGSNYITDSRFGVCDWFVSWVDAKREREADLVRGAGI